MAADLLRCGFLLRQDVVESEHHQGVGVGKDPFVDRKSVAGLVDALKHGDGVAGRFTRQLLKRQRRAVEKLQGSGDALQEMRLVVLGRLVAGPRRIADFGDGGEAVVQSRPDRVGLPTDSSTPSRC